MGGNVKYPILLRLSKTLRFTLLLIFAGILCAGLSVSSVFANTGGPDAGKYIYEDFSGVTYSEIVDGTIFSLADGDITPAIPIGFPFTFYGNTYNTLYICANGVIQFQTGPTCTPEAHAIPSDSANPNPIIAAWWGDLYPQVGAGTVTVQTTGAAPDRVFTVEFKDVPHYNYAVISEPIHLTSFQVRLYETTNVIEVYYQDAPRSNLGLTDDIDHTAGIEQSATVGLQYYFGKEALTTPIMVRYQVDDQPPHANITDKPDLLTKVRSANFTFEGIDPVGAGLISFKCKLDTGVLSPCTTPKSYANLLDGSHTFTVQATDSAGNVDPNPESYTWEIDATAPVIEFTAHPPSATNQKDALFEFTGSDPHGVAFQCQRDGISWQNCTSPQEYKDLSDGQYTFQVKGSDSFGNENNPPLSFTWTVDTLAPQPPVLSAPLDNQKVNGPKVTLKWLASAGATHYRLVVDAGTPGEQTIEVGNVLQKSVQLTLGSHTWKAMALDAANNSSSYSNPATFSVLTVAYLPLIYKP